MKRKIIKIDKELCNGCGLCVEACHEGAIQMVDGKAQLVSDQYCDGLGDCLPACPAGAIEIIEREADPYNQQQPSELQNWPVQLKLINPGSDYLNNADILVMADCVAYAYGNAHQEFIKDSITIIGCPKLDDNEYYTEKLTEIFQRNSIKSITVVRMEVPCCGGLFQAVKTAMLKSETIVPYKEVVIGINGKIKQ